MSTALLIMKDSAVYDTIKNRIAALQSMFFSGRRRERDNEIDAPSETMFENILDHFSR